MNNNPNNPYQQQPEERIEARCKQGKLIVTPQFVRVELLDLRQQTLSRASITGIDSKLAVPSIFGFGGGTNLIFHGQGGERLHVDLVRPKLAKQIVRMLGY